MTAGVLILLLILAIMFLPDLTDATHEMIVEQQTESAVVATGAGETTGDITLTQPLYSSETQYVNTVTSSYGSDTPVASSYDSTSGNLTISGLAASQSRTLTVNYDYDATGEYVGLRSGGKMMPTLILLMAMALVGASIWRMFS